MIMKYMAYALTLLILDMNSLFQNEPFISHAGLSLPFKIDCDDLSPVDLASLASIVASKIKFKLALGIPRGGDLFAMHLCTYADYNETDYLIVDDVCTTGKSFEDFKKIFLDMYKTVPEKNVKGVCIFSRGECPSWVYPIFTLNSIFI